MRSSTRKGIVVLVYAMKVYGVEPLILNFSTRWKWVASFMSQLFYPQNPLNRGLDSMKQTFYPGEDNATEMQWNNTVLICVKEIYFT